MARHSFMMGQRRKAEFGPIERVAQVDIIDGRARAIERGILIIAARRARLDRHRHAAHLDRRLGQRPGGKGLGQALAHGDDLAIELRQQGFTPRIGVGIKLVGPLVERHQPLADAALAHPLAFQDRVDPGADLRHLIQTDAVNFVTGQLRRRRRFGRIGIELLAIGQAPAARVMHRPGTQIAHQRALAIDGGKDAFRHDLFSLGGPIRRQTRVLELLDKRRDEHRLGRWLIAQRGLHLHRRVQNIVGRENTAGGVRLLPLQFAVHRCGKGLQTRQIGVGVRRILHPMLRIQEIGNFAIAAGQLREDIGRIAAHGFAIAKLFAAQRPIELVGQDIIIELARFAEL